MVTAAWGSSEGICVCPVSGTAAAGWVVAWPLVPAGDTAVSSDAMWSVA